MSSYATMDVEREGGIASVWFNRPQARNAVNTQFCHDLGAVAEELGWDDNVRVVLIRGRGPSFCAGADLKERQGWDERDLLRRRVAGKEAFQKMAGLTKPVIAAVHGAAIGAGAEIALLADFAYAAADAFFRWPEVTWGSVGATQRLARRIGKAQAKELLFTGGTIGAADAYRLGLVNRVVASEELGDAVRATAERIERQYPVTLAQTKRAMDIGTEVPSAIGFEVEWSGIEIGIRESEWRRGIDDFAERI